MPAVALFMRLSESIRKLPEVTIVSPAFSPERTTDVAVDSRPERHLARLEVAALVRHEHRLLVAGIQHRLLRDHDSFAVVDFQLHVGKHLRLQLEVRIGNFNARLRRVRGGIERRIDVGDAPAVGLSGVVAQLQLRRLADLHERQLILVNVGIRPDGGEVADRRKDPCRA